LMDPSKEVGTDPEGKAVEKDRRIEPGRRQMTGRAVVWHR